MNNAMEKHCCTCEYKRNLAAKMLMMRESMPGKDTDWVELLCPNHDPADTDDFCCLLILMFYYGYCEKCSIPVTEYARDVLGQLMIHHRDSCISVN